MNVLLLGSGGREHALARSLAASPARPRLFALPGSAAIGELARRLAGDPLDPGTVAAAAREAEAGLVVVGPEAPLAAGAADALAGAGFRCFGPVRAAARLESSKAFAKAFMSKHAIPTARYEVHDDPVRARDAAMKLGIPLVVKADGLAAGKGVRVCRSREEAARAVEEFMLSGSLGPAGSRVVLEECLEGPEATVMAFCDGESLRPLPISRDHKRLLDGDEGPNTGGMGAVAPIRLGPRTLRRVQAEVLDRALEGLRAERLAYRGLLYCGLMLTKDGPKALEFNVRFGDPETQAVLPLLKTDLLELLLATTDGRLKETPIECKPLHSVTVVLASEGYPGKPATGRPISGLEDASGMPSIAVFHAGTEKDEAGGWRTSGGRVLGVTALGKDPRKARKRAYAAVDKIKFRGMRFRGDIGTIPLGQETASPYFRNRSE